MNHETSNTLSICVYTIVRVLRACGCNEIGVFIGFQTEGTNGHRRTTTTPGSPDTTRGIFSENEFEQEHRRSQQHAKHWDTHEYADTAKKA